jgi:hypothetical protein
MCVDLDLLVVVVYNISKHVLKHIFLPLGVVDSNYLFNVETNYKIRNKLVKIVFYANVDIN